MLVLVTLLCAVLFTAAFRVPLKKAPWVFYLLAIALDLVVLFCPASLLPGWFYKTVVVSNVRGIFAFWLFAIVMFMGTLPRGTALRKALIPIRAELSILAAILVTGHCVKLWGTLLVSTASSRFITFSFVVAIILAVLLVLLTITSFYSVKRVMGGRHWKMLQRLAYPFFVLTYAHIGILVLPGATHGGVDQMVGIVVYGLVVVIYAAMRLYRYRVDRAARAQARASNVEFVDDTVQTLK